MRTPNLAPNITDKALRTYLQFLRDDVAALESKVNGQLTDQVTFKVTSGIEFSIGPSAAGGVIISSDGIVVEGYAIRNISTGCKMTINFANDAIDVNVVIMRVLK